MSIKTITVPPGIGDSIWLLQLLVNTKERFNFILPGQHPQRGKQVFDLLPSISNSCTYSMTERYKNIKGWNIQKRYKRYYDIPDTIFYLSANEWLEKGFHLKDFFVDLPIAYELPWQTSQFKDQVEKDLSQFKHCIGIYGSSYSTSRAWGFWQEDKWFELIKKIHSVNKDVTFIIIGAEWDINLSDALINLLKTNPNISYFSTVGRELGYVIELMKQLDYAFYFPSGLPILSETLDIKTDCVMFYPPMLKEMQTKWCEPSRTQDGSFKECQFCEPEQIFDWVKNYYKLFDRLQ
jgi:hypothetical protein